MDQLVLLNYGTSIPLPTVIMYAVIKSNNESDNNIIA